jgi:hypothetical protein
MDTVALVLGISHSTAFTESALSTGTKGSPGLCGSKLPSSPDLNLVPGGRPAGYWTRSQSFKTERTTYGLIRSACWPNFCESLGLPLPWMHGLIWIFKGQVNAEYADMSQSRRSALSALPLRSWAVLLLTVATATQIGCSRADSQQAASPLELRSSSFAGDTIPNMYSSCKGQSDISPELSWNAPSDRTQSFALIVIDKDSPFGFKFTHWVLYDMPSEKRELPENTPKQEQLPDGSRQGHNDYDWLRWTMSAGALGSSLRL